MNKDFKILETGEHSMKVEKDLIEIQKAIVYYGEKIIKLLKDKEIKQSTVKEEKWKKKKTYISHLRKLDDRSK